MKRCAKTTLVIITTLIGIQISHAADFVGNLTNGVDSTFLTRAMMPRSNPLYPPATNNLDNSGHTDYIGNMDGASRQDNFIIPIQGQTQVKFLLVGGGGGGALAGGTHKGGGGGEAGTVLRGQLPISAEVNGYYFVVGNAGMGSCGIQGDGAKYASKTCLDSTFKNGYDGGYSSIYPKSSPNSGALATAWGGAGGITKSMSDRYGGDGGSALIEGSSGLASVGGQGGSYASLSGKMGSSIGAGGGGGGAGTSDGVTWFNYNGGAGTPGLVRFCWGTDPSCD